MNGSPLLLDTNVVIPILNRDATFLQRIRDKLFYLPSIVLGELYYGARHSGKVGENLAKIELLKTRTTILACDGATADLYGEIKQALRIKGHPVPENDLWIAAVARQHHLTLVTRDTHFSTIAGLSIENWP